MAYTYKKEDEEYDVLKEGDYECYIEKIVEGVSSTGSKYLRVQLKVRDDVEQEGKNRVVSDFIRWTILPVSTIRSVSTVFFPHRT